MKVVLSPSSRRAPPPWLQSLLRLGPGSGSPPSASASQFVRQGGAVAVVAVKMAKTRRLALWLICIWIAPSSLWLEHVGRQKCQDFPSHRYFVATGPPRKSFNGAAEPFWSGGSGRVAVFIWSRFTSLWLNLCGQHRRPGYLTRPRGFYHLRAGEPQGGGLCGIEGSIEQISFKVADKLIKFLWALIEQEGRWRNDFKNPFEEGGVLGIGSLPKKVEFWLTPTFFWWISATFMTHWPSTYLYFRTILRTKSRRGGNYTYRDFLGSKFAPL